jgi:hypothetical protein
MDSEHFIEERVIEVDSNSDSDIQDDDTFDEKPKSKQSLENMNRLIGSLSLEEKKELYTKIGSDDRFAGRNNFSNTTPKNYKKMTEAQEKMNKKRRDQRMERMARPTKSQISQAKKEYEKYKKQMDQDKKEYKRITDDSVLPNSDDETKEDSILKEIIDEIDNEEKIKQSNVDSIIKADMLENQVNLSLDEKLNASEEQTFISVPDIYIGFREENNINLTDLIFEPKDNPSEEANSLAIEAESVSNPLGMAESVSNPLGMAESVSNPLGSAGTVTESINLPSEQESITELLKTKTKILEKKFGGKTRRGIGSRRKR